MCFPVVSAYPFKDAEEFRKWLEDQQKRQEPPKPDLLKITRDVARQT